MLDSGKISSFQLGLLLYPTVLVSGFLALPSSAYQIARNDLWLTGLPAIVVGLIAVYTATRLHELYPKQTIVQYSEQILGKIPGKILGVLFIFYNLHASGGITRQYADFIAGNFLDNTPLLLIMISMLLLSAIAARGGAEILARGAVVFFPVIVIPFFFLLLLIPELDYGHIFPILSHGLLPVVKGSLGISAWVNLAFLITYFLPNVSDPDKARRFGYYAVFGITAFLTYVNVISLFLLGSDLENKTYPLLIAFRYVNFGFFLENLESFVLTMWVIAHFLEVGVSLYAASLSFAHCFELTDYRPIVYPIALLALAVGLWDLPNLSVLNAMVRSAVPFHILTMHLFIPLLLLLVALIRRRQSARTPLDDNGNKHEQNA